MSFCCCPASLGGPVTDLSTSAKSHFKHRLHTGPESRVCWTCAQAWSVIHPCTEVTEYIYYSSFCFHWCSITLNYDLLYLRYLRITFTCLYREWIPFMELVTLNNHGLELTNRTLPLEGLFMHFYLKPTTDYATHLEKEGYSTARCQHWSFKLRKLASYHRLANIIFSALNNQMIFITYLCMELLGTFHSWICSTP